MKKLLVLCIAAPLILTALYFGHRYQNNRLTIIPLPFYFQQSYPPEKLDAPIVIVGDAMAKRVATFKDQLAKKISVNLSSPIKIQTLTEEGQNIHRSFERIKKLEQLPLIIILLNNTDENYEELFYSKDTKRIKKNFEYFNNINIQSLQMIFPSLSKLLYQNVSYKPLTFEITRNQNQYEDHIFLERRNIHYQMYSATLDALMNYAKKGASLLIPITTPLNLKNPPQKSCYGSLDKSSNDEIDKLSELIKKKDYKAAFNISRELVLIFPSNAKILHFHSLILQKLNRHQEAHKYAEMAIVFDCGNTSGNPIYNEIMKRTAKRHNFSVFDFHKYLADESSKNYVFMDDIYPQDFYIEKLTDILALKLQRLLKLDQ